MNPSELPTGTGNPSPSSSNKDPKQHSLKVDKKSHKIIKNASSPSLPPRATHHHHQAPSESINQKDKPRVIYNLPQRTIHVSPDNFKELVQRLTGKPPDNEQPAGPSSVSPAERFASIERTIPTKKERFSCSSRDKDMMKKMQEDGVQMGPFPGILSSESSALPPKSSENFTQAAFQPIPSENISQSQVTLPPISSQNFSPVTYPPTPWNIFSPETLPENMRSDFFSQRTSPWMPFQEFPPIIDTQSQTVLPFNDVRPDENSNFASSSEVPAADVVPPQTPPNMFSPFNAK